MLPSGHDEADSRGKRKRHRSRPGVVISARWKGDVAQLAVLVVAVRINSATAFEQHAEIATGGHAVNGNTTERIQRRTIGLGDGVAAKLPFVVRAPRLSHIV